MFEIPITSHPKLPEGVPLVATFSDDRNRLSYYYPLLQDCEDVRTPATAFVPVRGDFNSYPEVEFRAITAFMQDLGSTQAFVRGDFSAGKYDGEAGSKLESQDPYDIEDVVLELFRQLAKGRRNLGGRIAVREWIAHDCEVRYFVRNGEILYRGTLDECSEFPDEQARAAARLFSTFAWSMDFIRDENTGIWYLTDMGLDGLYPAEDRWTAISEHLNEKYSPEQYIDEMPAPLQLKTF